MFWQLSLRPGVGLRAERFALKYLRRQKLRLRHRNYACSQGEIDLIMDDDQCLVFIEVRFRKHHSHGSAEETVSLCKRRKIVASSKRYLQSNRDCLDKACRFDVVGVTCDASNKWQVNWIKNAFNSEG